MKQPSLILFVGGADTGRAPMAAALLRRLLADQGLIARVESAGVLGHDDDPAEPEARDAMATLGLDLSAHKARSLTAALIAEAKLLLTADSGSLLVLRARLDNNAPPSASVAELAGVRRDIPDPFRMPLIAWVTYAREIEQLLRAALPRILELAGFAPSTSQMAAVAVTANARASVTTIVQELPVSQAASSHVAAAMLETPLQRLLTALAEFPELFDWSRTRQRIEQELTIATNGDLGPAFASLIRALLAMTPATPSIGQLALLQSAATRLVAGPTADDIGRLSAEIASWATR